MNRFAPGYRLGSVQDGELTTDQACKGLEGGVRGGQELGLRRWAKASRDPGVGEADPVPAASLCEDENVESGPRYLGRLSRTFLGSRSSRLARILGSLLLRDKTCPNHQLSFHNSARRFGVSFAGHFFWSHVGQACSCVCGPLGGSGILRPSGLAHLPEGPPRL